MKVDLILLVTNYDTNMSSAKHHVFTHYDLDGAVSLLIMMWVYGRDNITWEAVSNGNAASRIQTFVQKNPNQSIILLDLSLREEFLPFLNSRNVKIFDHHISSQKYIKDFNESRLVIREESSNAMLLYKALKDKFTFSGIQKVLIKLADDFDSYDLKYKQSYDLNIVFWHWFQNKFENFINFYKDGYIDFSSEQKKAIDFIKKRAQEVASTLPLYKGVIEYNNNNLQVLATFADKFSPLVIDAIIEKHRPEMFFFANTNTNKVNLRQIRENSKFDISTFAAEICNGGGHHNAAGGDITPLFLELLKGLNPLK